MQVIKILSVLLIGFISISSYAYAQVQELTITTRTIEGGSDVMVASGALENKNFKGNKRINVFQKNAKHNSVVFRSYLDFDLSSIPANAIITQASLVLTPKKVNNKKDHPIYIERVSAPWDRKTLKWINQPKANSTGSLLQPHSAISDAMVVHEYNIQSLIQDMVCYPYNNHELPLHQI